MSSIYCGPLPSIVKDVLLINAATLFLYMTVWFLIGLRRRRIDTVDVAWALGFIVVAWSTLAQRYSHRSLLAAVLVSLWGLRLGYFLFMRARKRGEDRRYSELQSKWKGHVWLRAYFSIYLMQGLLIWLVSMPLVLLTNQPLSGLAWLSYAGAAVWLTGFTIEAVSDWQLQRFLADPEHPKVMDRGLWRYSRHPNYFGELVQWWGIGVIALQVAYGWIGLVGPLVLSLLIIGISGIPPIEKRRKKDAAYRAYARRTSVLVPLPRRNAKKS